jgi:REP element-mobilizing transposase RayT
MTERRQRPPRLERVFAKYYSPLYFVTMVTWQRRRLLACPAAHEAFVAHARKQEGLGVGVGRFVLMPDHAHFFIRIGAGQTLGESVRHLKQAMTKALRLADAGLRVWQPGFFDHLLRNGESYEEKWSYTRDNPVRAGLVERPEDWPYQGEVVRIDRL